MKGAEYKPAVNSVCQRNVRARQEIVWTRTHHINQRSESFGGYTRGCMADGAHLAGTGPTWQAMRLSLNHNWGQPILVDYVQDRSRKVTGRPGWEGLYIGDISQPKGGPMLTGHASHQIGLDADILMLNPTRLNLTAQERENISSISMRPARGHARIPNGHGSIAKF